MNMKYSFLSVAVMQSAYEPYMNHTGKFVNVRHAVFFLLTSHLSAFWTTLPLLRPNRIKLRATEEVKTKLREEEIHAAREDGGQNI